MLLTVRLLRQLDRSLRNGMPVSLWQLRRLLVVDLWLGYGQQHWYRIRNSIRNVIGAYIYCIRKCVY
jgi:hypothetical protein